MHGFTESNITLSFPDSNFSVFQPVLVIPRNLEIILRKWMPVGTMLIATSIGLLN